MSKQAQVGLFSDAEVGERWLTVNEAAAVFERYGADEFVMMRRAEDGIVRTRLNGHGLELHAIDVDHWARLEGAIAAGLRNGNGVK